MLNQIFRTFVRVYQSTLGIVLPNSCRFTPTCSEYAFQALTRYGLKTGSLLAIKRILRCHPFSFGGYDPVPEKREFKEKAKVGVKGKEDASTYSRKGLLGKLAREAGTIRGMMGAEEQS